METWNHASSDCLNSSKEIDGKFGDWINHASELHQACVTAEPTSEDQQVLKDIELAVAGVSIDYQQNISTGQLEKCLEAATEAFKRASDGSPNELVLRLPNLARLQLICLAGTPWAGRLSKS